MTLVADRKLMILLATRGFIFLSSFKSRVVDNALIVFYEGNRALMKKEIPDFALDRHTQRGRHKKRGWDHFFTDGVGPNIQPDAVYELRARDIRRDNRLELER